MRYLFFVAVLLIVSCKPQADANKLRLWYNQPAAEWTEALPVGNGRLGAMVYGGVEQEHIQFNEETLWTGEPHNYAREGASDYLEEIRSLLFDGKQKKAEELAMKKFMGDPLRQKAYQPFGDVYIKFPGHKNYTDYYRELDISNAICRTSYKVDNTNFSREVFASNPDQLILVHLESDKNGSLNFEVAVDALHKDKTVSIENGLLVLSVAVKDGVMKGISKISLDTDGDIDIVGNNLVVTNGSKATLYLSAGTNFLSYDQVSENPSTQIDAYLKNIEGQKYQEIKERHIHDYQKLFNRFNLDLGTNYKDTLPTDERIKKFQESSDPQLISMYVQYGRYLLISSSRAGTYPANLQGIWNDKLKPSWDSKYTVNINTEMNYWPAEVTNLSECHDPLFNLIEDCATTGKITAQKHYDADGWVLHHNTDQWRGTAPINHSNHGIWVSGSGWLSTHLWEHYLFTRDQDFLKNRAYPIMKDAALFYSEFLIEDPETGWLISTPSNSPENGGLAIGPTMDHQIIRSLFEACIEASEILNIDQEFAEQLSELAPKIAPNQIGQYGQLQEWVSDLDNPENKHRHVSHLWGIHPGKDINWEDSPELMEAAKQSLIFRGDEGTGWSLAWKINFWARFLDGNHAYELIKLLFRYAGSDGVNYRKGGSYMNLFDAHPPFQIDGNFGAAAGIVELLIQSHLSAIDLLPALPDEFQTGSISGVCARGGFELDFSWEKGQLQKVTVRSKAGEPCRLRYGDELVEFETTKGEEYILNEKMEIIG